MMILSGKLIIGRDLVTAGMKIEEGRIVEISKQLTGKRLKGLILPAGIDVHVHLRDFEESHKETIRSGTLSALHGGICLVVDQPNTRPFIDSAEKYERRIRLAEKHLNVDYSLNMGLTRRNSDRINEIVSELKEKGYSPAVGEVFLQHDNPEFQVDPEVVRDVEHLTTIHAELPEFVESNEIPNFLHRDRRAEIEAVKKLAPLGRYFCHISTREAFETISSSPSLVEVTPHHLLLDSSDYERLNGFVNVNPPLRERADREFLLENFSRIDVLASDHAPHLPEEKERGASGYPGVETMYPLMMGLVFYGKVSVFEVVEKIVKNPAEIFGFRGYGEIRVGNYANLAVFDISRVERVRADSLHSLCGWTPFEGFPAIFPHTVVLRGEIVKEGDEAVEGLGEVYKSGSGF